MSFCPWGQKTADHLWRYLSVCGDVGQVVRLLIAVVLAQLGRNCGQQHVGRRRHVAPVEVVEARKRKQRKRNQQRPVAASRAGAWAGS